jgi:argininosuccinate synthase
MTRPARPQPMERIVVPFTSVDAADAVSTLARRAGTEVVAVALDLGQAAALDELRDVALAAGALRCHVFELRERLAAEFLWPALRAGALSAPGEPIVTALSAPCTAEAVVEVARLEHATAVAACAPAARARQRLLAALRDLTSDTGVVTVGGPGTEDERNLWGRVRALGAEAIAPEEGAPAASIPAAEVVVTIERGVPVALNHVAMPPVELVDSLATIARGHGLTSRIVAGGADEPGRRWLVHAPAAFVLHEACAALIEQGLDARTQAFSAGVAQEYAALVRDGHWFTPLRRGLDAFAAHVRDGVAGEVRLSMREGRIEVEA